MGGLGHDSSRPYPLSFPANAKNFDFLKLDEAGDGPTAGWGGFMWNDERYKPEPGKEHFPRRGFFTYYPVERLKPGSLLAATFDGPKESRINGGKDEQPFIVAMPFGAGKSLYIGSGEFWRLRAFKDGYHDRLWIKMMRYVAAGDLQQKKYGRMLMARTASVGQINFEAQVKGKDLRPLAREISPTVLVRRTGKDQGDKAELLKFDLRAKPTDGDWQGYYIGSIQIKEPGEYEFQLPIPGTNEALRQSLIVRKPNPELDNVRTNFAYLYQLASPAGPLLDRLPAETRREIEPLLQVPQDQSLGEATGKKEAVLPRSLRRDSGPAAPAGAVRSRSGSLGRQTVDIRPAGLATWYRYAKLVRALSCSGLGLRTMGSAASPPPYRGSAGWKPVFAHCLIFILPFFFFANLHRSARRRSNLSSSALSPWCLPVRLTRTVGEISRASGRRSFPRTWASKLIWPTDAEFGPSSMRPYFFCCKAPAATVRASILIQRRSWWPSLKARSRQNSPGADIERLAPPRTKGIATMNGCSSLHP